MSLPAVLNQGESPFLSVTVIPSSPFSSVAGSANGVANPCRPIRCLIRFKASALARPAFALHLHALVGKSVRLVGTWCDMSGTGMATQAVIHPLGLLVARHELNVYDINGWPVAVRDYDVFAFSHIGLAPGEPLADESRTLNLTVPIPQRPSERADAFWRVPNAPDDEGNTVLTYKSYWQTEPEVGSGIHVGVAIEATFNPADRSVSCHCRTALFDTSDGGIFGLFTQHEVDEVDERTVSVAADATLTVLSNASFESDETVPERATVTLTITNRRRPS